MGLNGFYDILLYKNAKTDTAVSVTFPQLRWVYLENLCILTRAHYTTLTPIYDIHKSECPPPIPMCWTTILIHTCTHLRALSSPPAHCIFIFHNTIGLGATTGFMFWCAHLSIKIARALASPLKINGSANKAFAQKSFSCPLSTSTTTATQTARTATTFARRARSLSECAKEEGSMACCFLARARLRRQDMQIAARRDSSRARTWP